MGDLNRLVVLYLANNRLTGKKYFGDFEVDLTILRVTCMLFFLTNFSGRIPSEIGRLKKLETLRLQDNKLTGKGSDHHVAAIFTSVKEQFSCLQEKSHRSWANWVN